MQLLRPVSVVLPKKRTTNDGSVKKCHPSTAGQLLSRNSLFLNKVLEKKAFYKDLKYP